jgi:hypothetical protein
MRRWTKALALPALVPLAGAGTAVVMSSAAHAGIDDCTANSGKLCVWRDQDYVIVTNQFPNSRNWIGTASWHMDSSWKNATAFNNAACVWHNFGTGESVARLRLSPGTAVNYSAYANDAGDAGTFISNGVLC